MGALATIAAVVSASASVASAHQNYNAANRARRSQNRLEEQQAAELAAQRDSAERLANKQAKTGSVFGFGDAGTVSAFNSGLGFGSSTGTGFGRAQLTGGSGI